jgi:hypothetical protein
MKHTPHHPLKSASTSEIGKKVLSPDEGLTLPALKNDSFIVQLETVSLYD